MQEAVTIYMIIRERDKKSFTFVSNNDTDALKILRKTLTNYWCGGEDHIKKIQRSSSLDALIQFARYNKHCPFIVMVSKGQINSVNIVLN